MLNLSVVSYSISTATNDTIKSNSIFKFQVALYQMAVLVLSSVENKIDMDKNSSNKYGVTMNPRF